MRTLVLALTLCLGLTWAQPLSGTYTIGATGANFTTLNAAFAALNAQGISGPVRFEILPNYAGPEPVTTLNVAQFGPYTGMGQHSVTLTVHSSVTTPITIATSPGTGILGRFVLRLNGVDNFIIDGGPDRLLRFVNNAPDPGTGVIGLISDNSLHNNPCRNITIRNIEVNGGNKSQTYVGIFLGSWGTSPAAANVNGNNNILIEGCWVYGVQNGIALWGPSATNRDQNNRIVRCKVGHPVLALSWGGNTNSAGIAAAHQTGLRIEGDTVMNASDPTYYGYRAIQVGYPPQSFTSAPCVNTHIAGNWVHTTEYTGSGGWGITGIRINIGSVAPANVYVYNNAVAGVIADGWQAPASGGNANGIFVEGTSNANAGVYIYHNSIHLFGTPSSNNYTNSNPACLAISSGITGGVYVRNNIFQNTQSPPNATASRTTIGIAYGGTNPAVFSELDNNAYFVENSNGSQYAFIGSLGTSRYATLADWQAAVGGGREANSLTLSTPGAPFNSNIDLLIPDNTSSPLEGAATLITTPIAVLTDIRGEVRPEGSPNPDIGACEFFQSIPPCPTTISADQISISPASLPVGTGGSFTVSVNNPSNVTSPAQWEISIDGGPWQVYAPYQGAPLVYTPTAAGTYEFRLVARIARYHQGCPGLSNDTSNAVTGTVTCPAALSADQITVSPTSVPAGDPVTVTVTNPGNVTTPAVWQVSTSSNSGPWTDVASYNGSPFTYTPAALGNHWIRLTALPPAGCSALSPTSSNVESFTVLPPRGDNINDPIDITPQDPNRTDTTVNGNNSASLGYTNAYTGPGNQSSPDVFYRYVLRECLDSLRVSTCNSTSFGSNNDLYIHVINLNTSRSLRSDGGWCGGTSTLLRAAINIFNDPNTTGNQSVSSPYRAGMRLRAGDTLIIVVEGFSSQTGPFVLDVTEYRYNPANQPTLPQPPFFSFDTSRVCYQGGIVRDSLNTGQNNPALTHIWYVNGVEQAGVTGPIFRPQFNAPGIDTIVVEIRSANLSYCAPPANVPRDTVYIFADSLPKVDFLVDGSLYEHADFATISGTGTVCVEYQASINNPDFTYTWTINGSTYTGPGPHQECYNITQSADTIVLVTTNGACEEVDTLYVILDITSRTKVGTGGLSVYPNPAREEVYLRSPTAGPVQVQILDMRGQLVLSQSLQLSAQQPQSLNISTLPAGIYLLELRQGDKLLQTRITKLE